MRRQVREDSPSAGMRVNRREVLRMALGVSGIGGVVLVSRASGLANNALPNAATPASTQCAGSPVAAASPAGSPSAEVVVEMTAQLRFEPEHVTIRVGETIVWRNESPLPHTATGDPAQNPVATSHPEYVQLPEQAEAWGSAMLQPGESFAHTFTTPGEYLYICIPHVLSGMRGTITVTC